MIHHCITILNRQGGVQTYIRSLLTHQSKLYSSQVLNLVETKHQNHFQLLHLHDSKQLAAFLGECPAVFTLHNHSTYCPSGTKYLSAKSACCNRTMSYLGCSWGRFMEGCGSRRPQKILHDFQVSYQELAILCQKKITAIAISDYARQCLIEQGVSSDKVVTIHHGIQTPQKPFSPLTPKIHQQKRLLFVGRIVPEKGLSWLFKALSLADSQVHLDIAGEGWFQPELVRLAEQLAIQNRITWHGWCNPDTLDRLYQQCFAVVFPSLWPEPAGLITLEAYARLRPIIASQVGGIPEYVIANTTGLLVPPNDAESLAQAISALATDVEYAESLAAQGYNHFQASFTLQHHIEKLENVYMQTVKNFDPDLSAIYIS